MPEQKFILLWQLQTFSARQKDDLHSAKLFFCAGTKVYEEALNSVTFLSWLKRFGLAQNILEPVRGRGNNHLLKSKITTIVEISQVIYLLTTHES